MHNPKQKVQKHDKTEKMKKQAVFNPSYLIKYNYNVEYLIRPFLGYFQKLSLWE